MEYIKTKSYYHLLTIISSIYFGLLSVISWYVLFKMGSNGIYTIFGGILLGGCAYLVSNFFINLTISIFDLKINLIDYSDGLMFITVPKKEGQIVPTRNRVKKLYDIKENFFGLFNINKNRNNLIKLTETITESEILIDEVRLGSNDLTEYIKTEIDIEHLSYEMFKDTSVGNMYLYPLNSLFNRMEVKNLGKSLLYDDESNEIECINVPNDERYDYYINAYSKGKKTTICVDIFSILSDLQLYAKRCDLETEYMDLIKELSEVIGNVYDDMEIKNDYFLTLIFKNSVLTTIDNIEKTEISQENIDEISQLYYDYYNELIYYLKNF